MPARKERVYTFNPEENMEFEFPSWWNRTQFFLKFGARDIDTNHPLFVNYAYLLMPGEAISFNKACTEEYRSKFPSPPSQIKLDMEGVKAILKKAHWVIVESYEIS